MIKAKKLRTEVPLHILTDPVEGDLNPFFYPRMTEIANSVDGQDERMLPKVDIVIISHNHRDHVDIDTLKRLVAQQPLMIIPEGDLALFKDLGFTKIVELKWWEQATVIEKNKEILRITAVPTRHWSGRSLCDAHRSAFNGYVVQAPHMDGDIYFAGDTAIMEDRISDPIFEQFNIKLAIQPGGPDEVREDMKSTHQSSADAILMHFKNLLTHYKKLSSQEGKPDLPSFLQKIKSIKTIYNHTATFKLGTLRLRDTFYSVNRILAAFNEDADWRKNNLTAYEYATFTGINSLNQQMQFSKGEYLTLQQLREIVTHSIVIPKIGQRISLNADLQQEVNYRNLILNKRSLIELDILAEQLIVNGKNKLNVKEFLLTGLNAYEKPWHSTVTRSFQNLTPYVDALKHGVLTTAQFLRRMEDSMQPLNRFGHMQSLIHYAKWLNGLNHQINPGQYLEHFFICQKIRNIIDKEIYSTGYFSLISADRQPKQKAFKILANELAHSPVTKTAYQEVIKIWQDKLSVSAGTSILNQHRLFPGKKTHSESVVEETLLLLLDKTPKGS